MVMKFAVSHCAPKFSPVIVGGCVTVTVVDASTVPLILVQEIPKTVDVASGAVDVEPEAPSGPDQPPVAVQLSASVADQESVEVPLRLTLVGDAVRETVAALTGETVTDDDALPPGPVHISENVVGAVIAPVDCVPDVPKAPLHPLPIANIVVAPLAVPCISAVICAGVNAPVSIRKSCTSPLRYGSGHCERPIQFCVVLPRLDGVSVMFVLLPTCTPST